MGANDYGVVISVTDYKHVNHLSKIEQCSSAFREWLTATEGGDVPQRNVFVVPGRDQATIQGAFKTLFEKVDARRLYIHAAGIGSLGAKAGLSLLMHDMAGVELTSYADTARRWFHEVVFIGDCVSSDVEVGAHTPPPGWVGSPASGRIGAIVYAVSVLEEPRLTYALLQGLQHDARTREGVVTAASLIRYLDSRFGSDYWWYYSDDIVLVDVESPTPADRVSAHADDPAVVDELGRRPFAEVIGKRIEEVRAMQEKRDNDLTFMIHLHGPWGSGKTSVLNFLREYLEARNWVVVEFNAWRHQRMRPPWWALIQSIYSDAKKETRWLSLKWWLWRFWADLTPALITVALLLTTFSFIVSGLQGPKDFELAPKLLVAIAAAAGAIWTYSRSLIFGSARAAQTYTELRSDPLAPIVQLFRRLIRSIKRPVVVFIDDLDRCDSKFVIELLEGIQTLFRSAPVTYVVAADRKWICSSFDQTFEPFGRSIGDPGRPLGYLFLEKVFQVSASVPRLSEEVQGEYWKVLLRGDGVDPRTLEERRKSAEKAASQEVSGAKTHEELDAKIAAEARPLEKAAMRAAAAKQIISPEARKETEHRLQPFAGLLEPNPRAMKRLVNAYGLHQASNFLEGRDVPAGALARWTIIELRWPLLAEYLAVRPEYVKTLATGILCDDVPEALKPLFFDGDVRAVAGYVPPDAHVLDEAAIRSITGR